MHRLSCYGTEVMRIIANIGNSNLPSMVQDSYDLSNSSIAMGTVLQ